MTFVFSLILTLVLTPSVCAQNIRSSPDQIFSRVSRWVEVLGRESQKNNAEFPLSGAYRFDWERVENVFSFLQQSGWMRSVKFDRLARVPLKEDSLTQQRWLNELMRERKNLFGVANHSVPLTRQSHIQSALLRINDDLKAAQLEFVPSLRWLFVWDAVMEGKRLQSLVIVPVDIDWDATLVDSRASLFGSSGALAVPLMPTERLVSLETWLGEVKNYLAQLQKNPESQIPLIWFLFAREGIESMIVLFCVLAGLETLYRRKVFAGAGVALVLSFLFYFGLSHIVRANPSAPWIRYFVLINVLISMSVLLLATNFNFHRHYWSGWIAKLRIKNWQTKALFFAGFFAIFREGMELSLAMTLLQLESGTKPIAHAFVSVLPLWLAFGVALFILHRKLPLRTILLVSGAFMLLVTVVFAAFATRLLQTFEWIPNTPFIEAKSLPLWIESYFAFNGSRESTLLVILTVVITAYPLIKSLRARTLN